MGKKGTSKREKHGKKMDLSICIFVAFFLLFRFVFFCFCFVFFLLLPGKKAKKKQNKSKTKAKKANRKSTKKQQKCNGQVHVFPIFPRFCFSFLFPFFSLLFCFCVFWILLICFLGFPFVLHFSRFFSSFKTIRISYGLVNIIIRCHKHIPWRTIIWLNYPQEPKVYRDRSRPKSLDNSWIQVTRVWMSLPQQVLRFSVIVIGILKLKLGKTALAQPNMLYMEPWWKTMRVHDLKMKVLARSL